jgi:tRNA pseudouridine55 synthase
MATGLLIIGVNAGTKLLTFLVGEDKTYLATIRLGQSTNTDDAEGELVGDSADASRIAFDNIHDEISKLSGQIMQIPSSVSAIKVDGKRAYALVRGGVEVKLQPRPVTDSRFEVAGEPRIQPNGTMDLDVVIECSSGTYVRALARDLGLALGVGGHLTALRRTRVGGYAVEDAVQLDDATPTALTPLNEAAAAAFNVRQLNPQEVQDIRHGKRLSAVGLAGAHAGFDETGEIVAMLEEVSGQTRSSVVFADV